MTDAMRTDTILIAFGGNAISPDNEEGTIPQQFAHTEETMRELVTVLEGRYPRCVITHGNGPQIGNILLRSEIAAPAVYPLPLDTCVSDSEGGMGYMIQQVLRNVLVDGGDARAVACILTQVLVARDDPAWDNPTKYIGRSYPEDQARELMANRGWRMKLDAGRGWRRVVASPTPLEIVELDVIRALLDSGVFVIAAGGGGIPVIRDEHRRLRGVEAVIDKDLASSLLASQLGIGTLAILTGVEKVAIDFGKPTQRFVSRLTVAEAEGHLAEGQFPAGSMGPKIRAAIQYVRTSGGRALISSPKKLGAMLAGETGTEIVPD